MSYFAFFFSCNMIRVFLFAVLAATAHSHTYDESVQFARCVKGLKKFMMTRVCAQQDLAVVCLNIDTPYVTEAMDYCYKELNLDPIDLQSTLQWICYSEESIEEAADCLCRASWEAGEDVGDEISEEIEHDVRENEDFHPEDFNKTLMHCLQYMNDIYRKRSYS